VVCIRLKATSINKDQNGINVDVLKHAGILYVAKCNNYVRYLQGRIRDLYKKLSEKLDAGKTANHLYQQGALTKKEFEEIQQLSTDLPTRAAEQLLKIVLSQTEDFLDCFLDSLIKTDQLDVHQWIVLQGVFMLPRCRFQA